MPKRMWYILAGPESAKTVAVSTDAPVPMRCSRYSVKRGNRLVALVCLVCLVYLVELD